MTGYTILHLSALALIQKAVSNISKIACYYSKAFILFTGSLFAFMGLGFPGLFEAFLVWREIFYDVKIYNLDDCSVLPSSRYSNTKILLQNYFFI